MQIINSFKLNSFWKSFFLDAVLNISDLTKIGFVFKSALYVCKYLEKLFRNYLQIICDPQIEILILARLLRRISFLIIEKISEKLFLA